MTIPTREVLGMSLEERVLEALRNHAAPALDLDGSEIEVIEVADGIASVRLGAICSSCPATFMTVVTGLERELKMRVPEVEVLEAVL